MTAPTIVVPLDGTEHALLALPVARHLAALRRATLHLVHVARETASTTEVLDRIGISAAELRGAVLHTKAGDPAAGIIAIAGEVSSELVVMCTRTASTTDTPLGRTALAVLQGAPCPVILVRPGFDTTVWALRRLLLPHDGTPTTSAAMAPCAQLARSADAELTVLHVAADGARGPMERGSLPPPRYVDQPQHEWPEWVSEFLGRLGAEFPMESLKIRMSLTQGSPPHEALRFADAHAIDLIVLAWRGRWQDHATTVKEVLLRANCPVMVVRAKE